MKKLALLALLLSSCTNPQPISTSPLSALPPQLSGTITQGLTDASFNLDNATALGILAANDPAASCLHSVIGDLTGPLTAGKTFTPRISDLISAGSVLYIQARQAASLATGPAISEACKAEIGQIVIDANSAAKKASGLAGATVGLPILGGVPPILP